MLELGRHVPLYAVAPFVLLLLGIAVLPLAVPHAWEKNWVKASFAGALSAPIGLFLWRVFPEGLTHTAHEYVSFVVLLGSLYVVAGGIHVGGDIQGTPGRNVAILALGAVLASAIGTTGASMVLVRLMLRTNRQRKHVGHIPLFFILIVSNCGGLLTPLGDPPLFLGFLRGVPFLWTLRLAPIWVLVVGYLLLVFWALDRRAYARESASDVARDTHEHVPVSIEGAINVLFLATIVGAVFAPAPLRELLMLGAALASVVVGPEPPRRANGFTYGPIAEVAILFGGIFVTMVPALALLEARGGELGLTAPWQFFLATGGLSSVLDNAPTYLTFLSAAQGLHAGNDVVGVSHALLVAISAGAVLMGANTYIGNGPNFMVKAIADEAGFRTPGFFGFAALATLTLTPVYVAITLWLALAA